MNALPVIPNGTVSNAPFPTRARNIPVVGGLIGNICGLFPWEARQDDPRLARYHRQQFFELVWFNHGEGIHFSDLKEYSFKAGCLVIVPMNQVHAWQYGPDTRGFVIQIPACVSLQTGRPADTALLLPLFSLRTSPVIEVNPESWQAIDHLCALLAREHTSEQRYREQIVRALLDALIVECSRHLPSEVKSDSHAARMAQLFVEAVEAHFTTHHKVQDYVKLLAIPEHILTRSVQSVTGKRPREILQDRLLLESRRLLVHSTLTVAEIGYKLGFKTPSNFGRFFKGLTGGAPRQSHRVE